MYNLVWFNKVSLLTMREGVFIDKKVHYNNNLHKDAHGFYQEHLFWFRIRKDPNCTCGEIGNLQQFLFD